MSVDLNPTLKCAYQFLVLDDTRRVLEQSPSWAIRILRNNLHFAHSHAALLLHYEKRYEGGNASFINMLINGLYLITIHHRSFIEPGISEREFTHIVDHNIQNGLNVSEIVTGFKRPDILAKREAIFAEPFESNIYILMLGISTTIFALDALRKRNFKFKSPVIPFMLFVGVGTIFFMTCFMTIQSTFKSNLGDIDKCL